VTPPIFRRPYQDDTGRVQFDGYGWFVLLAVPWLVGVGTILDWLL
jgi:hypothetical protein